MECRYRDHDAGTQPKPRLTCLIVMRTSLLVGVGVLLTAMTGCTSATPVHVASSTPGPTSTSQAPAITAVPAATSTATPLPGAWCRGTQLAARYGGRVSPMTGEHSALITVWNVSRSSCRLPAYPTVALFAGRDRLPFRFQRGGAYIQDRPRPSVVVALRAAAHFLIAKYRCDVKSETAVTTVGIGAVPRVIRVPLPAGYAGPTLEYCGPASNDPGNTVEVGPYILGPAQGGVDPS